MKQLEKKSPQWKAPDTLLYSVMKEVDKCSCGRGFYSWAAVYRYLFCTAGVATAGVVCLIANNINIGLDILQVSNDFNAQLAIWYNTLLTIHSIFYDLTVRFLQQPAVLVIVILFTVMIIIAWTGSVAALYQMTNVQPRRKYI